MPAYDLLWLTGMLRKGKRSRSSSGTAPQHIVNKTSTRRFFITHTVGFEILRNRADSSCSSDIGLYCFQDAPPNIGILSVNKTRVQRICQQQKIRAKHLYRYTQQLAKQTVTFISAILVPKTHKCRILTVRCFLSTQPIFSQPIFTHTTLTSCQMIEGFS